MNKQSIVDNQLFGSGCARKFPLKELELNHLSQIWFENRNIFLGINDFEDVGAYVICDDQILVQSVDVIASLPIDPYDFGAICSAHCLSDLYAKGVLPLTAYNILFHSVSPYYPGQINEIFAGITDKLREANTPLLGGHTVNEKSLYCGLMVSGVINKKEIVLIKGVEVGDDLILTKPLGTGIISLAVRNKALDEFPPKVIASMSKLNISLTKLKNKNLVHSCTDVTGSGLAGSLYSVAIKNSARIEILGSAIPYYEEAWDIALNEEDGALFNRDFVRGGLSFDKNVKKEMINLFFDPQTSGGLLLSVSPQYTNQILEEIFSWNISVEPKVIGKITGHEVAEILIL